MDYGLIITIVLAVILAVWFVINFRKMIDNVKHGRSIDGCTGNCAECHGCSQCKPKKKKRA